MIGLQGVWNWFKCEVHPDVRLIHFMAMLSLQRECLG